MRMLSKVCATALFSLALAGCASHVVTVAPPLTVYSPAQQKKLADEYPSLPDDWKAVIRDYKKQRNVSRALSK